MQSQLLLL